MEGTDLVLTGHTLDDQIETVEMRRARGAKGPGDGRGLAGMAPATLYDGRSWLLRPLLGTERAALRAWLTERAIGWIDDPTNVDSKYERARLRAATAIGQDTESARSRIAAAASERAALGEAAAALIRTHAKLAAPGLVALNLAFAERRHGEAAVYALRIMLAAIGGMEQLPDARSGAALFERFAQESFRSTLSRVVIDATARAIFLRREGRGLPGPSRPPSGGIWDGRFRIGNLPEGATLAPAGIAAAAAIMDASSVVASDIAPSLREVGTGDRAGAVARRPMPGSGGRVRHGAANHRALGALPALVRPCAGPRGGGTCRRRYCARAAIRWPQRAQRVTEAWAFRLAMGGAVPMLTESLHTDRYP